MQYRLLYQLSWMHAASLERTLSAIVKLVAICLSSLNVFKVMCCTLLNSKSHLDLCNLHLLPDKSHMTYHVISFDCPIYHVTFHMINPDIWLLMSAYPLWITDMITGLGQLPNWDIGSTSYLGNTPFWKLQNSNDWKTKWPDCDIRTSFPSPRWLQLLETWKERANPRIGIFATYPKLMTLPLKPWVISNAHLIWSLNQGIAYLLNLLKTYDTC